MIIQHVPAPRPAFVVIAQQTITTPHQASQAPPRLVRRGRSAYPQPTDTIMACYHTNPTPSDPNAPVVVCYPVSTQG